MVTRSKQSVLGKLGILNGVTPAMIPNVDIEFSPSVLITANKIDRFAGKISSFREPLTRAVKEILIPSFRANFEEGGRPDHWEPLSADTLEIRSRLGGDGDSPLIRTGALEAAATSMSPWKIGDAAAVFTSLPANVWYGTIHQGGYEGKSMRSLAKKTGSAGAALQNIINQQKAAMRGGSTISGGGAPAIPARPFILVQDEDEDAITELFIEWVDQQLQEAWPAI
jgi:phage gpG-like protein